MLSPSAKSTPPPTAERWSYSRQELRGILETLKQDLAGLGTVQQELKTLLNTLPDAQHIPSPEDIDQLRQDAEQALSQLQQATPDAQHRQTALDSLRRLQSFLGWLDAETVRIQQAFESRQQALAGYALDKAQKVAEQQDLNEPSTPGNKTSATFARRLAELDPEMAAETLQDAPTDRMSVTSRALEGVLADQQRTLEGDFYHNTRRLLEIYVDPVFFGDEFRPVQVTPEVIEQTQREISLGLKGDSPHCGPSIANLTRQAQQHFVSRRRALRQQAEELTQQIARIESGLSGSVPSVDMHMQGLFVQLNRSLQTIRNMAGERQRVQKILQQLAPLETLCKRVEALIEKGEQVKPDPRVNAIVQETRQAHARMAEQEKTLTQLGTDLGQKKTGLDTREAELNRRQAELDKKSEEIAQLFRDLKTEMNRLKQLHLSLLQSQSTTGGKPDSSDIERLIQGFLSSLPDIITSLKPEPSEPAAAVAPAPSPVSDNLIHLILELKGRIAALEAPPKTNDSKPEDSRQLAGLRKELRRMQIQLFEDRIKALEGEKQELQQALVDLERSFQQLERSHHDLQGDALRWGREEQVLRGMIADLRGQLQSQGNELRHAQEQLERERRKPIPMPPVPRPLPSPAIVTPSQLHHGLPQISSEQHQQELQALQKKLDDAETALADARTTSEQLAAELTEKNARIEALEAKVSSLSTELGEAKANTVNAQRDRDAAGEAQKTAEQARDRAILDRDQARADRDQARTDRDTAISERDRARRVRDDAERSRDAYARETEAANIARAAAEEAQSAAENERDRLKQRLEELERKLAEVEEGKQQADQAVADVEKATEDQKELLQQAEARAERAEAQAAEAAGYRKLHQYIRKVEQFQWARGKERSGDTLPASQRIAQITLFARTLDLADIDYIVLLSEIIPPDVQQWLLQEIPALPCEDRQAALHLLFPRTITKAIADRFRQGCPRQDAVMSRELFVQERILQQLCIVKEREGDGVRWSNVRVMDHLRKALGDDLYAYMIAKVCIHTQTYSPKSVEQYLLKSEDQQPSKTRSLISGALCRVENRHYEWLQQYKNTITHAYCRVIGAYPELEQADGVEKYANRLHGALREKLNAFVIS